jgi:hypothetical protein
MWWSGVTFGMSVIALFLWTSPVNVLVSGRDQFATRPWVTAVLVLVNVVVYGWAWRASERREQPHRELWGADRMAGHGSWTAEKAETESGPNRLGECDASDSGGGDGCDAGGDGGG